MKNFLFIGFLALSLVCYVCFLLIDGAPVLLGVIGVAGILLSLFFNIKSLSAALRRRKKPNH
ncbi:MAG: hypothetical protein E7472_05595 [Ruminococcaceae bacterium]|nr:hypothetical protein [Oscillospiraceae bacterium]